MHRSLAEWQSKIESPLIVVGAPRSGTTILYRCLAVHADLWCLPAESHRIMEGPFHPSRGGYESNRVDASSLDDSVRAVMLKGFYEAAINLNRVLRHPGSLLAADKLVERAIRRLATQAVGAASRFARPDCIRLLEKTPKNSLRVPMLARLFPNARFVWLRRSAVPNVKSIVRGWHTRDQWGPFRRERFATYPVAADLNLKDYVGRWWKFALVPGWRTLSGTTVADVAALQYNQCNAFAGEDLAQVRTQRVFTIEYEDFVASPAESIHGILSWADLSPSRLVDAFAAALPRVNQVHAAAGSTTEVELDRTVNAALDRSTHETDATTRFSGAVIAAESRP